MSNNFNIMGIYKIINKSNGKFYIGSSMNIHKRWNSHISALNSNRHHNQYLQRAWDKYGADNFEFKMIEVVNDFNLLEDAEQRWISNTKCYLLEVGYNLSEKTDRPDVEGNKAFIYTARTDMQKLILGKDISKNKGYMLFVLGSFLSKYDNSVKINYKHPSIEELMDLMGVGTNVLYKTLRELEEDGLIKRIHSGVNFIIYMNPYYIRYGKTIDDSIYKMFNNQYKL